MKRPEDPPAKPTPLRGAAARRVEAIIEGAEKAAEKVIDDAEEQARAYLAEAEAEADRAVAERVASIAELSDALLRQADSIRRQAELLTQSLAEAKERLEGEHSDRDEGRLGEGRPENGRPSESDDELAAAAEPDTSGERRTTGSVGAGWRLSPVPDPASPRLSSVEPAASAAAASAAAEPAAVEPAPEPPVGRAQGSPAGARLLATQMAVSGSSREEIAARLRSGFEIDDTDAILDAILGPES